MNKKKTVAALVGTAILAALAAVTLSPKTINCTGTPDNIQVYDLGGAEYSSLTIEGAYCHVKNVTVRGSISHGLKIGRWVYAPSNTHHVEVSNFHVYDSTTEGLDGVGSWGSCLKVETNAHDIYIHDGSVERCGGEAVGITGAENVKIDNLLIRDGKQAGLYIDNTLNMIVSNLTVYCGTDPLYYRNGKPSRAVLLGDEDYAQTLHASKLGGIVINNVVSYGCGALQYWGGQVEPNGVAGLTVTGVWWDAYDKAWINAGERNQYDISGIVYKTGAVITPTINPTVVNNTTPTPTKTPAPTITRTPTPIFTPALTLTATKVPTATPVCVQALTVWVCDKKP